MSSEELAEEFNALLAVASLNGIVVEMETRDGQYHEVGAAECYTNENVILRV